MADDKIVAALLRAREHGNVDSVQLIDKQLASLGVEVPSEAPVIDRPDPAARGRRTAKG